MNANRKYFVKLNSSKKPPSTEEMAASRILKQHSPETEMDISKDTSTLHMLMPPAKGQHVPILLPKLSQISSSCNLLVLSIFCPSPSCPSAVIQRALSLLQTAKTKLHFLIHALGNSPFQGSVKHNKTTFLSSQNMARCDTTTSTYYSSIFNYFKQVGI